MSKKPIKIFISYRRDDSQYVTDSIHDHLVRHFGVQNVFLDVESIPFGVDFRKHLASQVADNDAVLVIIGPDWARIMKERANQPNDFVRIEIESALEQEKLVIPVLVKDAQMPDFSELPASINDIQWLNSASIRRKPHLESDCSRLSEGIREYFGVLSTRVDLSTDHRDLTDLLPPPFVWIDIPSGQVTLADGHGTFDVPAFSIGKYPITVAQFEVFMHDGGYSAERWWTNTGWSWLKENRIAAPHYWDDREWQSLWLPEHPIVGVSWFEAFAFTRWLSDKTGEQIYLPLEQQWQRAAQGSDSRAYPWGSDWDASRCNNDCKYADWGKSKKESGQTTTPVTEYEGRGDSPFGVVDLAGNVWEWTNTAYETAQRIDLENTDNRRVVRGGSWNNNLSENYQVASRYMRLPDLRQLFPGFRLMRLRETIQS